MRSRTVKAKDHGKHSGKKGTGAAGENFEEMQDALANLIKAENCVEERSYKLADAMHDAGISMIKVDDDGAYYLEKFPIGGPAEGKEQELLKRLIENGYGKRLCDLLDYYGLMDLLSSIRTENGGKLPDWLKDVAEYREVYDVYYADTDTFFEDALYEE